jgi:hypothetical protein
VNALLFSGQELKLSLRRMKSGQDWATKNFPDAIDGARPAHLIGFC